MNIPVLCIVSARSNTGKTTFTEKLISEMVNRGYKVGAIKSDCHGFEVDVPGKDSWRFSQAGASATAIIGPNQYAYIEKTVEKKELDEVVSHFHDVDLILVEGFKLTGKPKIEVVRKARGTEIVSRKEDLLAIATDIDDLAIDVPIFSLDDYSSVADFIIAKFISK